MARHLTKAQSNQNKFFLLVLRRTGNVRLAAREVGVAYSTLQDRRRTHAGFAVRWDAALVFFQSRIRSGTGVGKKRAPFDKLRVSACPGEMREHELRVSGGGCGEPPPPLFERSPSPSRGGSRSPFRTVGGEPHLVRTRDGRLQLQRAQKGKLTRESEQAFLSALSATCNVTLSAAAAGASPRAFYRRRERDPAFAREVRLAIAEGYERLEMALLESGLAYSHEHDDWRSNERPAVPPMTVNQALQLMCLHQKQARLNAEPDWARQRRGESDEVWSGRMEALHEARMQRDREDYDVAEAARRSFDTPPAAATQDERDRIGLPDLAQVTGWSRADPRKAAHDERRALFGGWRIEEMEEKMLGEGHAE